MGKRCARLLETEQEGRDKYGNNNTRFSATAPDDAANLHVTIRMTPIARQLDEVVIYGGDARRIVEEALKKIPANYSSAESMMSAFYRETVQKGQRYIGISEAMMDVYKTSYTQRNADRNETLAKIVELAPDAEHLIGLGVAPVAD